MHPIWLYSACFVNPSLVLKLWVIPLVYTTYHPIIAQNMLKFVLGYFFLEKKKKISEATSFYQSLLGKDMKVYEALNRQRLLLSQTHKSKAAVTQG